MHKKRTSAPIPRHESPLSHLLISRPGGPLLRSGSIPEHHFSVRVHIEGDRICHVIVSIDVINTERIQILALKQRRIAYFDNVSGRDAVIADAVPGTFHRRRSVVCLADPQVGLLVVEEDRRAVDDIVIRRIDDIGRQVLSVRQGEPVSSQSASRS